MMVEDCLGQYPVAIIEDRYSGFYAGGKWIAIADFEEEAGYQPVNRLAFVMNGAHDGDDGDAMAFWASFRDASWLAVGDTPDKALAALRAKHHA